MRLTSWVRGFVVGVALLACVMVALTSYVAVARDGGLSAWILAVLWAVGGVVIAGAVLRGLARHQSQQG